VKPAAVLGGVLATLAAIKLAGDVAVRDYERVDLDDLTAPGKVVLVDGQPFHVLEEGSGPALVLIHGLGDSIAAWRKNIPVLARDFRVVAVDLPAHGLSTRSAPDLSLAAQTRYVKQVLDQLGVDRATVVGHSMGGSVAQRLAAWWPDLVDRLVLISSTTDKYMRRLGWASPLMAAYIPAFVTVVLHNNFMRRLQLKFILADASQVTPETVRELSSPGRIRGQARSYKQLMIDRNRDRAVDLEAIKAPTLIIWGDRDRLVSVRNGKLLAAAIADAKLVVIRDAGHLVPEEQPEALNRLITDFAGTSPLELKLQALKA
jgi:pimeloyl-ACP methyl ester carboxylesterase